MKRILFYIIILSSGLLASCSRKENLTVDDIPGLGGDTWTPTAIDTWLYDSLTHPFNIAVKYKWDPNEVDDTYILSDFVPADESIVIPLMQAVKKVWANNYVAEKDSIFFKQHCPKFINLFGSAIYNASTGTKVLGIAEGGNKINLLEINTFKTSKMSGYKPSDSVQTKMVFHTVHHEMGHILHQTIMYPLTYQSICAGLYTTNWVNYTDQQARQDGFITAYSMQDPNEDFVEMISVMLTEGKANYDNMVNSITGTSTRGTTSDVAKSRLRQKESIVVDYFKNTWGIDFYDLQTKVRASVVYYIY